MERLQQDSTLPLEQHKQEVMGEIDSVAEGAADKAPSNEENPFVAEAGMAAIGGHGLSMFMTAREEMTGSPGPSPLHQHGSMFISAAARRHSVNSMFVGHAPAGKATRTPVSLVPMSYGEKKATARVQSKAAAGKQHMHDDLFARSRVSGMSLTGGATTGKKKHSIKGMAMTPAMASALGVGWLLDELSATNRTMAHRYANAPKRLQADLQQGVDAAEELVLQQRKNLPGGPSGPMPV